MLGMAMLTTMFDYNSATNQRLLERAANLSDAQLDAPTEYTQGSLRKTLYHMLIVEYGWRSLCQGVDVRNQPYSLQPTASIAEMQAFQQEESERARTFIANASEDDLLATMVYKSRAGQEFRPLIWQILTHILYHSAQHRSEIALWLTQHGQSPGDVDFLFFIG